jgi:hypothetical protein
LDDLESIMRKVLLATAAFGLLGASQALAAEVTITSSLEQSCTIDAFDDTIELDGITPVEASFTSTCNFSSANVDITFDSLNGALHNSVEDVDAPYTLTYDSVDYTSAALEDGETVSEAAGTSPNVRTYEVALDAALTIAGDYSDTLTITVVP